jgi:nucleoid DNA-binding protein
VNRTELVEAIAGAAEVTKKQADEFVQLFIDLVTKEVAKGKEVNIPGFVKFSRVRRKARNGINPATQEKLKIKAKNVAKISPLKALRDAAETGKVETKSVAKKPAAKKVAKKVVAKKPATKKAAKPAAKKVAKKVVAKKPATKKAAKPAAKKVAKKTTARKK